MEIFHVANEEVGDAVPMKTRGREHENGNSVRRSSLSEAVEATDTISLEISIT